MQFQVPQFIETEDKIVGPFSIRQFIYVGVAAVASAIFYFMVQTWLFVILATILMGGALAISFVKVGGRPLAKVISSAAGFYWHPQTYVWQPEHSPVKTKIAHDDQRGTILEEILSKSPLHKSWENMQTGAPLGEKESDRQFIEKKMAERYQIFQRVGGDRSAARRVDYR